MNYADTVERVMALLKERKVCSSSRKSHRDCYESLGLYLTRNNTEYTAKSHDEWFSQICRQYETLMKIKKMVNAVERRLMYLQGALDRSRMLA